MSAREHSALRKAPPARPARDRPESSLLKSVTQIVQGEGEPLVPADRAFFESRFGIDFSNVRVHHGADSRSSAEALNSAAYTVGSHIVLGAGAYEPGGSHGRAVLAHELAHVEQHRTNSEAANDIRIGDPADAAEAAADTRANAVLHAHGGEFPRAPPPGRPNGQAAPGLAAAPSSTGILRRLTLRERAHDAIERVKNAIDPRTRQFMSDMIASVRESPSHVGEFFTDELWQSVKEHWPSIVAVSVGLMAAETVIGALEVAPTGVTQVIGAILEIIVLAVLGYFAAVEIGGVVEEGINWWKKAKAANGDAGAISDASRSFVRMVWHIFMAVLAVAGVRARIRGGAFGRIAAPFEEPPPPPATPQLRSIQGGNTEPVKMVDGKVASTSGTGGPTIDRGPVALARGGGSAAPELARHPLVSEPAPTLKAVPKLPPTTGTPTVTIKPGVQAIPAIAAGVALATKPKQGPRPPFVLRLPQQKATHLGTYRSWLGVLQSDPNYARGSPAQLDKWHQALRIGGSHGIPPSVYERGHSLGFHGAAGERRIRVPDWSRTSRITMEVDHIIELQVTPSTMRQEFNSVSNYELLDRTSNGTAGPLLQANIAAERAKQIAFDPSKAGQVMLFDKVELDGGAPAQRWGIEELQHGEQLDAFERQHR